MKPQETEEKASNNGIRKATVDDIPEIVRINIECRMHNYKGIVAQDFLDVLSVEEKTQGWTENFEETQKNKSFYLKEVNGKIVGFIN
jgi:hypothetical protein